jgi:hypothetical protein
MDITSNLLRYIGLLAFLFYLIWNMFYLSNAQLPPSILYKLTGIPAPTTGMYRSLCALAVSDINGFLMNNPVVILFIPILTLILLGLIASYYKRERLSTKKQYTSILFMTLFFGELVAIKNYLF